ncbi:MAG: FAD-binding oxidoreductase [Gammaproteobacteria bacterium]|nr:FAD-binding oxidoreductase [Gammaproteobacteria bacterium]
MNNTIKQLIGKLGPDVILTGADISGKYHADSSGETAHPPVAVARPGSTSQVSDILRICSAANQKIVVQGGLTGLCGGATPQEQEVALSLERLNGIEELDQASMTMTVLAGTPLQAIQVAADEAGFLFPLDLGARGSCNIGGNISTNAGGNEVIRFGMTRNLILGLEVVLADGTVITSLNKMLKNNAGYDLKHLFIGTEGTLGIVTRAVLRLFAKPEGRSTALVALESFDDVISFLHFMSREFSGSLSSFEVMWDSYYDYIMEHVPTVSSPFDERYPIYVLTEIGDSSGNSVLEDALAGELEEDRILDAVICKSEREREAVWAIRDGVGDAMAVIMDNANFDVSVPINAMADFLKQLETEVKALLPDTALLVFGHIGDGNLHLVFTVNRKEDKKTIYDLVYRQVGAYNGSISAEHGIGIMKRAYLHQSRSAEELALMKLLKRTMDPNNILNPGRVIT